MENADIDPATGKPEIDAGDVFVAILVIMWAAVQMGQAAAFGPDMGKAEGAARRIYQICDYPSSIDALAPSEKTKRMIDPATFRGKIEFRKVWFRYPTRKEDFVLRGLDLLIEPQTSVALVGESGCGKSTFINLVMRFYDVDDGAVLIDDIDIKEYNLHSLRTAMSLVMQEPIIFNYTILENVLYGKLMASNSEVLRACTDARCMEFIDSKNLKQYDETADSMIKEMEKHRQIIVP